MFELNVIRKRLLAEKSALLFLRLQRICALLTLAVIVLFAGRIVSLSHEEVALQGKITKLQGDIANSKGAYSVDALEREWTKYVGEIDMAKKAIDLRTSWGGRLAILSRVIPRGLFVDALVVSPWPSDSNKRMMVLDTVAYSKESQGFEIANNLMDELKKTKQYGDDVKILSQLTAEIDEKDMETIQIAVKLP